MEAQTILQQQEGKLFWAAIVGVFLSFQLSNSPLYLLLLWSSVAGLLCAYITLRAIRTVPNLLLHMTPPPHVVHKYRPNTKKSLRHRVAKLCPVCGSNDCERHPESQNREYLHPWDGLMVPATIDNALSEILEIVMKRFVYSWHRYSYSILCLWLSDGFLMHVNSETKTVHLSWPYLQSERLTSSVEGFEDELRLAIRHAASILLRRAGSIDIPHLVTHKLSHALASHIRIYLRARNKLSGNTSVPVYEAVLAEYGSHTHVAMRGKTADIRYFRRLAQALVPILVPHELRQSKPMCMFLQELFAVKVFVPAMNAAAKPDFINKLLLVTFDPNSRLERFFGPSSNEVSFLGRFAKGRKQDMRRPLDVPVPELTSADHHLYTFMTFMKSIDNIRVLTLYLNLDDLKKKVNGFADNKPEDIISQVENLYETYLLPTSPNYVPLESKWVDILGEVLLAQTSASEKCEQLKMNGVFGRLRGYIYTELLMKVYGPKFHKSTEFYDVHVKKYAREADKNAKSRKVNKWKQKGKQFKSLSHAPEDQAQSEGRDSPSSIDEASPQSPVQEAPFCNSQVVDSETCYDGIRPFTVYTILSKRFRQTASIKVKRRFKEFTVLDSKLRDFHGEIPVQLPPKRPFKNMEKEFVEKRCKELEHYLQNIIGLPGVRESQILCSFLSDSSDPSLFLPDSMGDKAEKMIKSVPNMLKREKGQHLEELLQSLLQDVESLPAKSSSKSEEEVTEAVAVNKELVEKYLADAAEDLSDSEADRYKPWLHLLESKDQLQINSVMDLLIYIAIHVYEVSPWQLAGLNLVKLLGEETVETVVYNFVGKKVELSQQETKIVQLIHLFRDNVILNNNPPRTEKQIQERLLETLNQLITYPNPLFVKIVGEQRYCDGTGTMVELLQCGELNKQLFFKLLDVILLELFPELGELK